MEIEMKAIKITETNRGAIESWLLSINGKANGHTYTSFSEIEAVVERAERKLTGLLLPKKEWPGARFDSTSGTTVANAYKYRRIATGVVVERRATAWFIVSIRTDLLYKEGGRETLSLSAEQDASAVRRFREQYITRKSPIAEGSAA